MFQINRFRLILIFTIITGLLFPLSQYPTVFGKWKYLEPGGQIKWIFHFNAYLSGKFILYKGSVSIPDNQLPIAIQGKFRMSGLNAYCEIESGDDTPYSGTNFKLVMNLNVRPVMITDSEGRKFIYLSR